MDAPNLSLKRTAPAPRAGSVRFFPSFRESLMNHKSLRPQPSYLSFRFPPLSFPPKHKTLPLISSHRILVSIALQKILPEG
jgi:hypothetical protein